MRRSTKIRIFRQGASMPFYPAALPLSRQTLACTAGIIRRHRVQIGSPWRKLIPSQQAQQALLGLAYLRKGETFAELAAGFGIGTATAWRYVSETVALLAARSPKLHKALGKAKKAGHAYVVIDGTLIPIDRVAADRPFYSGRNRRLGMNPQVIASPDGDILWSRGRCPVPSTTWLPPGSGASCANWPPPGWWCWRTRATPVPGTTSAPPARGRTSRNRRRPPTVPRPGYAARRARQRPAQTWRILRKLRCCPWKAGQLANAIHVFQARENEG
jgi:Helix-turn-helix of DDE superfamily endonuclease